MHDDQLEYNIILVKLLNGKEKEVRKIYHDAILNLAILGATMPYRNTIFNLSLYPLLKLRVDYVLKSMATKLEAVVINGIDQAFQLSDHKNRVFLDKRLKGFKLKEKVKKTYYDSNIQAKKTFVNRREKGLNLSKRIWKTLEPFKKEVELGLAEGIATGQSAKAMAASMKQNLVEPDKLFRRVRVLSKDSTSRLKLSKAAVNYKPGQGVYRSSFKNALRLTRTETNIAYRTADYHRWASQPFVVGIEIKLSNNHPKYDMCDVLAGKYPKDFLWTGWHPQCICFQVPILITMEEMEKYQDKIFGIGDWDGKSVNKVDDAPPGFYKYLKDNKDKINGLSSVPYWVNDNLKYMTVLAA